MFVDTEMMSFSSALILHALACVQHITCEVLDIVGKIRAIEYVPSLCFSK